MKIALVQCPAWGRQNPPLALAMLSAFLRSRGRDVYVFDLNNKLFHSVEDERKGLWQLSNESFWDNKASIEKFAAEYDELLNGFVDEVLETGATLIGFSVYSSSKEFSLLIAQKIKNIDRSKTIVFGGPQSAPHMQGGQIINNESVDLIAVGEGEVTLSDIVESIIKNGQPDYCKGTWLKKNGKVIDCGKEDLVSDLNELPFANFEDFQLDSYSEPFRLPIYFSRGCVNRCVYCNENIFWKGYRSRSGARAF
ncbi:MAG: hypothetical protein NT033_03675, partial [Candidatus Omnitrophica bacterium]|nr:hypothetical protein [Candidatus Omnitrophota bacterium]